MVHLDVACMQGGTVHLKSSTILLWQEVVYELPACSSLDQLISVRGTAAPSIAPMAGLTCKRLLVRLLVQDADCPERSL